MCFTYRYGDENRRVYGMVKDIDTIPYENMLKMDNEKKLSEKDSFVKSVLQEIEEKESNL